MNKLCQAHQSYDVVKIYRQHDFGANGQENEPRVSLRLSCESMVLVYPGRFRSKCFSSRDTEIEQSRNLFSPASYQSSWQFWVSNMSKMTKEFVLKLLKEDRKFKPCPSHWTFSDFQNAVLKNTGCKDVGELLRSFDRASKLFFRY